MFGIDLFSKYKCVIDFQKEISWIVKEVARTDEEKAAGGISEDSMFETMSRYEP